MRRVLALALLLAASASASAQFSFRPAGELQAPEGAPSRPGAGRVDERVYAPGMRFPMEEGDAFANSQIYGPGGFQGPPGGQCDASNYSFPWFDNYCEARSWDMPLCPSGTGHQGQDIRPATCDDNAHWVVAAADGVVTNDQLDGGFAFYIMGDDGTRYDYLHMASATKRVGERVARGERIGRVSNRFGGTSTTIHLHFNIQQNIAPHGTVFAPTYMSLVRSFEERDGGVPYRATYVNQTFPLSSQPFAVSAGELIEGSFSFRNDGAETWRPGEVFLGTTQPRDGASPMASPTWSSPSRAASVAADTAPGEIGVFNVTLQAPTAAGEVRQFFNLVREGVTWFSDSGGPADNVIQVRMDIGPCTDGPWTCQGNSRVRCIGGTSEREACPAGCSDGVCSSGTGADNDNDGFTDGEDCNDMDDTVFPGAREFCGDGIDQDCSGVDAICASGDAGVGPDGGMARDGGGGCGCRVDDGGERYGWCMLALVFFARRRRRRG